MEHATTLIGYRDPLARAYLRSLLRRTTDMTCAAEADSLAAFVDAMRGNTRFTFALLDFELLGASEDIGLRYLADRYPACRLAVLVDGPDDPRINRLMAEGAAGCISKALSGDALIDAFRLVAEGAPYVPPVPALSFGQPVADQARAEEWLDLTERQLEVLQLLALGYSNREISEILSIAEGTVKVHVNAAFRVLGVHNRVRAAAAMRDRLQQRGHPGLVGSAALERAGDR